MIKRILLSILFMILGLNLYAQKLEELERLLKQKTDSVVQIYSDIKEYRNSINELTNRKDSVGEQERIKANKLLESQLKNTLELKKGTLNEPYFDKNEISAIESSVNSNQLLSTIDGILTNKDFIYENLIFQVNISKIPEDTSYTTYTKELIENYNFYLGSFGRRLGRLIQMSMLEKENYVTPTSWSRFNVALYEVKEQAEKLDFEIHRSLKSDYRSEENKCCNSLQQKVDSIIEDNQTLLHSNLKMRQWNLTGVFDTRESFGFGFYASKGFDYGCELMYTNEYNGDIMFHPKIGLGQGLFHFSLGGLYFIEENIMEMTGNVYVINNRLMGGLSFGKDRIMLTLGINSKSFE